MKFPVSEIFCSIQGEGNYAGVNALFVRFQFCNLACRWCDSKYTWAGNKKNYKEFTDSRLKDIIRHARPYHIILTGGEPALYRIDKLAVAGKKFHVESNGTLLPLEDIVVQLPNGLTVSRKAMKEDIIQHFNWVISPKLKNAHQQFPEETLSFWAHKDYAVFKFVVQKAGDLEEAGQLIKRYKIDNRKVYICLEGTTLASQINPALVKKIIARGWNFSPRLQVILWNNRRKH